MPTICGAKLDAPLSELLSRLGSLFDSPLRAFISVLDIALVAFLVYRLLKLVRGTRAWRVVLGLGVFVAALALSERLGLSTLHWLLDKATLLAPVALVILFLPELRQTIESFARLGSLSGWLTSGEGAVSSKTVAEVSKAVEELAQTRTGALIVLERGTQLDDICGNGIPVQAVVTAPLLVAIFYEGNPLHDGAVVVRGETVLAAACRLPLSESTTLSDRYHMRHRAGLGMSEQSDAVVVIVSEERGQVSLAIEGRLETLLSPENLRERLEQEVAVATVPPAPKPRRRREVKP